VATLAPLTAAQAALADRRAALHVQVLDALVARAPAGAAVSLRDLSPSARQVGRPSPDMGAERAAFRAAGLGRFATSGALGDWYNLIGAAAEASRSLGAPLDLAAVTRTSMAWCLAGRPADSRLQELLDLAREILSDSAHTDTPQRPFHRRTVDGWAAVLAAG